jgi:hypothetical protein
VAHSDLARDAVVAQAIAEVLRSGETARLQDKWTSNGKAEARISDTQLRRTHTGKVDFAHMEPEARQAFLRNLNEPPQLKLSAPAAKTKRTSAGAKRKKGKGRKAAKRAATKSSLSKPRAAKGPAKRATRRLSSRK